LKRKLGEVQFGFATGKDRDAENNIRINIRHRCAHRKEQYFSK